MNYSSTSVQHDSPQCVRVIPKLFPQRRAQFRKHEVQSLLEEEEGSKLFPQRRAQFRKHEVQSLLEEEEGSGGGWGEGEKIREGVGKLRRPMRARRRSKSHDKRLQRELEDGAREPYDGT